MTILDLSGMRAYLDGDKDEEREIVQVFIGKSKKDLAAIAASITAQSLHDWQECCHSLKGSAALLGAFPLKDLCHEGEIMDVFDFDKMTKTLAGIEAAYGEVLGALAEEDLV
jgi:HPt (histidine-containing phosphotransfer) domain-containing protein